MKIRHLLKRIAWLMLATMIVALIGIVERGYYVPATDVFILLFGSIYVIGRTIDEHRAGR